MKPPGRRTIYDIGDAQRLLFQVCDYLARLETETQLWRGVSVEVVGQGAGTEVLVRHGLGRVPTGWCVTDKQATGDLWRPATATWTQHKVGFEGTAGVTFTVRLFYEEA